MLKKLLISLLAVSSIFLLSGCEFIFALLGMGVHEVFTTEEKPVENIYKLGVEHANKGNHSEAATYFKVASDQGHLGAQCRLGICYLAGLGVPKNPEVGVSLLRKPAENGDSTAVYLLGVCYYNGYGVPVNRGEAAVLLNRASQAGNSEAKQFLREHF